MVPSLGAGRGELLLDALQRSSEGARLYIKPARPENHHPGVELRPLWRMMLTIRVTTVIGIT